ncbi:MAG: hypothetical protein CM15mP23_16840 [Cryomorphaceae bacterium]|nr:MAG: hypothetical protein CM15mP23_16840 [Cryomorphaceae bacterium]
MPPGFAEAGNAWGSFSDFNPFEVKRSLGFGIRIFMPMFGLLGFDFAHGYDPIPGATQRVVANALLDWSTILIYINSHYEKNLLLLMYFNFVETLSSKICLCRFAIYFRDIFLNTNKQKRVG